jgi:microcystin-dependent protein
VATNPIPQAPEFKVIKTGNRLLDTIQDNVKAALKPLISRFNAGDGIPVGFPAPWFTNTPPAKWLLCQGQLLSQAQYPALYAVLGNQYNLSTDAAGWFRLPNANGASFLFAGKSAQNGATNHTLGQTGGEETHLLLSTESGNPPLTSGYQSDPGISNPGKGNLFCGSSGSYGISDSSHATSSGQLLTNNHTHSIAANNAAVAHNNLHPYLCVNLIIKYLP